MNDRATALLDVFRQGLQLSGERQSQTILGDRTTYIGMSDIGRYADCPRAAVASKLLPQPSSLERLLTLQRGHWFENGVGDALAGLNLAVFSQLEIRHDFQETPIRAHLDFTLVWDAPAPAVRILEVKSMESLPDRAYPAHEIQIQGQVDLLRLLWSKPVFSLRSPDGTLLYENLTFPQLCKSHLGVEIPKTPANVSLEGWLLCLSMREARAFGSYEYHTESLERLLWTARDCWADLRAVTEGSYALKDMSYALGFHPLCISCEYNSDCPKFPQGECQPQWNAALNKLDKLKASRNSLDTEIREMEGALKQAHQLSGTKDWISTGQYRFRTTSTAGRRTLDRDAVREELEALCTSGNIPSIDVNALFQRHEHEGAPFTRLSITPINNM